MPDLPTYYRWKDKPLGFVTVTALKERGLSLAPDQPPVAYLSAKGKTYTLYDQSAALPKLSRPSKASAPE